MHDALKKWHDRLGDMIDRAGDPDSSPHDLVPGLRQVRDEMFASLSETEKQDSSARAVAEKCADMIATRVRQLRSPPLLANHEDAAKAMEYVERDVRRYAATLPIGNEQKGSGE